MVNTKVTIIPIDLGYNIQDLIAEGVEELTGQAKNELEAAITMAKERDTLRIKQNSQNTDRLTTVMEDAYNKIVQAGDQGIMCSEILSAVSDLIPNSSAFALRMKKLLRDKGNPFSLTRKKVLGNPHYVFIAFNQE